MQKEHPCPVHGAGPPENRLKEKPDADLLKRLAAACEDCEIRTIDELLEELEKYEYTNDGQVVQWIREQVDNTVFEAIAAKFGNH